MCVEISVEEFFIPGIFIVDVLRTSLEEMQKNPLEKFLQGSLGDFWYSVKGFLRNIYINLNFLMILGPISSVISEN